MAAIVPEPAKIRPFRDAAAFDRWLAGHHDRRDELWVKFHKKGSGLPSVTYSEALDVALCWGWIDGVRKSLDETSFLQRFTPRTKRSRWSQINCRRAESLIAEGRMQAAGLRQVEAARADGRWDAAYASPSKIELPEDLLSAVRAVPAALEMLGQLSAQNRFALAYRLHHLRTAAARARNIEKFVAMLARGEAIYPSPPSRAVAPSGSAPRKTKTTGARRAAHEKKAGAAPPRKVAKR